MKYHVYKKTVWSDAKVSNKVKIKIETNQSLIAINPYACELKQNISILMAGKPLVTFREKFQGIFTSSSKKKVQESAVI